MKILLIILICIIAYVNVSVGQVIDTLPVYKTRYQHLIVNYNNQFLKYTEMITVLWNDHALISGFKDFDKHDEDHTYFINGKNHKRTYYFSPNVDTVNTIRWFDGKLPQNNYDSIFFDKKIRYSFVLYRNHEKRLNEDNVVKVRMLVPEDNKSAQGKWRLVKASFYVDSAVCITKLSDITDSTGREVIRTKEKKIIPRKQKSLLKELNKLGKYEGCECFQDNFYPILLEYYDGNIEQTYIISNRCKIDKNLKRLYEKVIIKVWNL
ncbi:MAG: hypothetical protein U1C46_07525 [Bacteroidales bacterium]|nr:hypothetical protein [Bacteroidales bacterium]